MLHVAAGGDHGGRWSASGGGKARGEGRMGMEAGGVCVGVELAGLVRVALVRCDGFDRYGDVGYVEAECCEEGRAEICNLRRESYLVFGESESKWWRESFM